MKTSTESYSFRNSSCLVYHKFYLNFAIFGHISAYAGPHPWEQHQGRGLHVRGEGLGGGAHQRANRHRQNPSLSRIHTQAQNGNTSTNKFSKNTDGRNGIVQLFCSISSLVIYFIDASRWVEDQVIHIYIYLSLCTQSGGYFLTKTVESF